MKQFFKDNWFKIIIAACVILIGFSTFYYFVVLGTPKTQSSINVKESIGIGEPKKVIGALAIAGKLRKCPSTDCEIIRYYAETAKIKIVGLDDNNEWYQVQPKDDYGNELNGWMHYSVFVEDFRSSFVPGGFDQQEASSNDKILGSGNFLDKLGSLFSFLRNKQFQIISIITLIILFVLMGGFLFREKLKVFFNKIKKGIRVFLSGPKTSKVRHSHGTFRKKRVIIVAIAVVLFIGAGTGLGFFIKSKFDNLKSQLSSETSQKENAQKLAAENAVKMGEAQEEANREKIAKNQKALELAQKEKTERELNADKDGDGLTYRQEIGYGTSDSNTDSDSDGIPDGQDMHPAGGGSNMPQTFAWSYGSYNYTFTTSIPEDWFFYYKNKPRLSAENITYVTYEDKFIKEVADKVLAKAKENSYCEACLATAFIQSLPYVDDVYTGYDEYPKYPLETLFEKNGDCEDTSYLTAAVIGAMNIDTKIVLLPGHMAVAVWVSCDASGTYYKIGDKCYYYLETTGDEFQLGDIPDDFKYTPATLVSIFNGTKYNVNPQYKKPCNLSSEFSGYYYDGVNYFSDSQCYNLVYCLPYKGYYVNPRVTDKFYWDSGCSQQVVSWYPKSTNYPGYFYSNISTDVYTDSQCTQKATFCRSSPNYSDTYYNGYNDFWDSSCSQRVVSWCPKSIYHPGYFYNSIDTEIYTDSQCTIKAGL